ncbi:MAG: cyclic nucleotide-binding domain-containing protein [Lachnospiraceae bacterium]|nr:cyclic nucleotide-binding domain-containing protein [Lachnospiraceae bacterium]
MKYLHHPRTLHAVYEHPSYREWFGTAFREQTSVVSFAPGETLIDQGEDRGALFLLLEGRVCISAILPNGKHRIINTTNAPALLGELELLEMVPPTMSVRALEECQAAMLPYELCRDRLLADNTFLIKLAIQICHKERTGVQKLLHTFSYPLENRLARFLLQMQEEDLVAVKKVEAADSLGVSYRHLSQVMKDFVDCGYLEKEGRRYRIKDPSSLCALARQMEET